ncbi:lung adenoma susceptibility protein 2 isoform X5 [Narcine bancroftii]|uniref:lung adenoma susceptibility protein 2 isoform X5 n=1 Tax=Narcine bancroftii TaxID=1343680 RepID=UPI0038318A55
MTTYRMNHGASFHSPDLILSKLLTNAGHQTDYHSHSSPQDFTSSVVYRGQMYQSASEALEAYIDNFEKKLSSSSERANKLHLGSSSNLFSTSPHNRREVFRQQNLDFPMRPLQRRAGGDLDLMSLTTDDLLDLPPDGSLPLTQASVLQCLTKTKQPLRTQLQHNSRTSAKQAPEYSEDWRHRKDDSFALLSRKAGDRPLSFTTGPKPFRILHSVRGSRMQDKYKDQSIPGPHSVEDCRFGHHKFNSRSWKNYPRWLTSQKSELDVSGISSVPEMKYPCWLQDCDIASDLNGTDGLTEDHIDSLIQKAENVLGVLSHPETSLEQYPGSPSTEEVLDAERSWDNPPVTFKSPVPVGNSGEDCCEASNPPKDDDSFLDSSYKCHQRKHSGLSEVSGRKHHGPVEALKQMLFSLQTVQQSFDSEHTEQHEEIPKNVEPQTLDLDFEEAPGSKSLQRALSHLKHLKELVDDIGAKKKKEAQPNQCS